MAQSINITIADKVYNISAASPEHEEVIRKAAKDLDKRISQYVEKFPKKPMNEILSFLALNICMNNIILQNQMSALKDEETRLEKELKSYLENIDKNSR